MLNIAKRQVMDSLLDAKFLFLAVLILLAFTANGIIFSESYKQKLGDYRASEQENRSLVEQNCDNLQRLAVLEQRVLQPPSALSFIAEGGSENLPNVVSVSAFARYEEEFQHRIDETIPTLPSLDWSFIIGILMTLLAVLISYDAIAGERQKGTLRLVLSHPVSRLQLFVGKYLGLVSAMLLCFFVGILFNLTLFVFLDGPPLAPETIVPTGWAILISILCFSFYLLLGLTISSSARNPAVSLVILLVVWILAVAAVPGIGRLAAEQSIEVPSQAQVQDEIGRQIAAIAEAAPRDANFWNGDPFAPNVKYRAQIWTGWNEATMRINDDRTSSRIRQVGLSKLLSYVSPQGILADTLQKLGNTGIHGYVQLFQNTRLYRNLLYQYVVDMDSVDPATPHLVYGSRGFVDPGTFSQRPVEAVGVPKATSLWSDSGLVTGSDWPALPLILLLSSNFLLAMTAFFTLLSYDPR